MSRLAATLAAAPAELKENFEKEKARLKGEARSQARMIKAARDIPMLTGKLGAEGPARPIEGAVVRMRDGKQMIFHTDGSLRHAFGRAITKAERKALKRARREKLRAQSS